MRKVVHVSKSFLLHFKELLETVWLFSRHYPHLFGWIPVSSWSIKDVNLPTFQKRAHNFRFVALGVVLHENSAFMNVQISSNLSFSNLRYFVPNMVVLEQLCPTQMAC